MDDPEEIHNVKTSQFSIARHFGGVTINGRFYCYDPVRDVLTREDVVKRTQKEKRDAWVKRQKENKANQANLFGDAS